MRAMRLAEIVGVLSAASDAGTGAPDAHALRGATLAVRFARHLEVDDRTLVAAYYLPLLAMAGCTAESHASAEVLGDEVLIGTDSYGADYGDPSAMLSAMFRTMRRSRGPVGAAMAIARSMTMMSKMVESGRAHCEVALQISDHFGFDESIRVALEHAFERWDGRGKPAAVKGEALSLAMRIAHVAIDANIAHRVGGMDVMVDTLRKRAGKGLDPALVERFVGAAAEICAPLDDPSPWNTAMAAEPEPHRVLEGDAIDEALRAIAHFTDLKCEFTRGHSSGVAELARAAAEKLKLGARLEQDLFRAGLVHDVGRVATTALVWDKVTPLTDAEREQIRMHTYVGERVLSKAPCLASVAEIATMAHERLDASGYHRRLPAGACTSAARVLAAADVYQALREDRPHRRAFGADQAASELSAMAKAGTLCPDAVTAVLAAAGHTVRAKERPGGLTDREVEVLRLLARGLTNKEIATSLDISVKTAGHHVQHVLEKLGVTTRAGATMIAMKTGLVLG
jgi:HD-GYP domain-containing protein (c-di-GMP phosphodiesterase class II)